MERYFSHYHSFDEKIIRKLCNFGFSLTGGTALEYWQRALKVDVQRKRSDNDLDFFYEVNNRAAFNSAEKFLTELGFKAHYQGRAAFFYLIEKGKTLIEVDLLALNKGEYITVDVVTSRGALRVCRPTTLYLTKLKRYLFGHTPEWRKKKDYEDLKKTWALVVANNEEDLLLSKLPKDIKKEQLITI